MVVLLTVWLAIMLIEGNIAELLLTLRASKVLGMPCFSHGIDDLSKDWLLASSTDTLGRGIHSLAVHVQLQRA